MIVSVHIFKLQLERICEIRVSSQNFTFWDENKWRNSIKRTRNDF